MTSSSRNPLNMWVSMWGRKNMGTYGRFCVARRWIAIRMASWVTGNKDTKKAFYKLYPKQI